MNLRAVKLSLGLLAGIGALAITCSCASTKPSPSVQGTNDQPKDTTGDRPSLPVAAKPDAGAAAPDTPGSPTGDNQLARRNVEEGMKREAGSGGDRAAGHAPPTPAPDARPTSSPAPLSPKVTNEAAPVAEPKVAPGAAADPMRKSDAPAAKAPSPDRGQDRLPVTGSPGPGGATASPVAPRGIAEPQWPVRYLQSGGAWDARIRDADFGKQSGIQRAGSGAFAMYSTIPLGDPAKPGAGAGGGVGVVRDDAGKEELPANDTYLFAAKSNAIPAPVVLPRVPGVVPAEHEEIWVISRDKPADPARSGTSDALPGAGTLMAVNERGETSPLVLSKIGVEARIDGPIANVHYTQTFTNPQSVPVNVTYVLPLPADAGVYDFVMTVGDRRIRGIVCDRAEAAKIYQAAMDDGRRASLIALDGTNIFSTSISGIAGAAGMSVEVSYFHVLPFEGDSWVFRLPTRATDRFNGASPASVEVSARITINSAVSLEGVRSPSHEINLERPSSEIDRFNCRARVTLLSGKDGFPAAEKDFELRIAVAGDTFKPGLITYTTPKGDTYFASMLIPPKQHNENTRRWPMEYVLLIDRSAAMSAENLALAKRTAIEFIKNLDPNDTWRILVSDGAVHPIDGMEKADPRIRGPVVRAIEALSPAGNANLAGAIRTSWGLKNEPIRPRFLVVISAGKLADASETLWEIQNKLHITTRVISVSVGADANTAYMHHLAKCGRGVAIDIADQNDIAPMVKRFFDHHARPALTEIRLGFNAPKGQDVLPRWLPDLTVGRPVFMVGRWIGVQPNYITVGARSGYEARMTVQNPGATDMIRGNPAIAMVWARRKMEDMADYANASTLPTLEKDIRAIAAEFGMVSPWTSLIAVDATPVKPANNPDKPAAASGETVVEPRK